MLGRREVLKGALFAGVSGLASCASISQKPVLIATDETLPKIWLKALPSSWIYKSLKSGEGDDPFIPLLEKRVDLLALGDGWLSGLSPEKLQSISAPAFERLFDFHAENFLQAMNPDFYSKVLPVGVSPWVLLFRNGAQWLNQANQGWQILLDPSLKKKIVLPESPRLVMSLAERMKSSLSILVDQALTFDDRNTFNWLLKGNAQVAIVPLQRCISSLRRDPRLGVVLPRTGAPLHWTVLIRPRSTKETLPQEWIDKIVKPKVLSRLLIEGWRPPLRRNLFSDTLKRNPEELYPVLFPSEDVWSNCWSLPPLSKFQKAELVEQFKNLTP